MNNTYKIEIGLEKLSFDIYTEPPEDPLGEFSDFEMALRRFFFECNHLVLWKKGYITLEEKEEFISPAFASSTDAVVLSK